jgi:hypothetical protein
LRLPSKPWIALLAAAVVIAALLWGIDLYRHRYVRSDRDLFRFLPEADSTVFYVNVAGMRQAGMLQLFAGAKAAEETDYRTFIHETRFDYTRDVDAVAGAADASQVFFLVRGRFDWGRLRAYAISHGGNCTTAACEAPTSKPGRWASFLAIQPDVLALALSANPNAIEMVRPPGHDFREILPTPPIWARISHSLLMNPAAVPIPLRIFAISLQSAHPVVLSLSPDSAADGRQFKLELDAHCANAAAAETIRSQFEIDTKLLKLGLARAHITPNAADLSGLLTSGAFQVVDRRLIATWPVRKELLRSLE